MKIKIKGDGTCLRTNDPVLALIVLKSVTQNTLAEPVKAIMGMAEENFEMPEFAPTKGVEEGAEKGVEKNKKTMGAWSIEQDKLLADSVNKKVKVVCNMPILKKNHTPHAIKTRLSLWKNRKYDRVTRDRANVMRAYISGETVETPVADITKNGKESKNIMKNGSIAWSKKEEAIIEENPDMTIANLMIMLPGRTRNSVVCKRKTLLKKLGIKVVRKSRKGIKFKNWTAKQEKALRDNWGKSPKELTKLPYLNKKTPVQIGNKIQYIKNHS